MPSMVAIYVPQISTWLGSFEHHPSQTTKANAAKPVIFDKKHVHDSPLTRRHLQKARLYGSISA